jgi:hypothetical protein
MKTLARLLLLASLASLAPLAGAQSTWFVDVNGTPPGAGTAVDPYTSIQYAIDQPATLAGDTLLVAPGVYVERIRDPKGLRIEGAGPELCTILPDSPGRVVFLEGTCQLIGFTITGGDTHGVVGGDNSVVQIFRCAIVWNEGDGLRLKGYSGWSGMESGVSQCTISENGGAGIYMDDQNLIAMSNSIVYGNESDNTLNWSGGFHGCCSSWVSTTDIEYEYTFYLGYFGQGNFEANPVFLDRFAGDFRLAPGSPCIGVGWSGTDLGAFPYDPGLEVGISYCTAGTSASGCQAHIQAWGTPSATASEGFFLSIVGMEGAKDGLFFYGINGQQANPWGNGTSFVCVVPPRARGGLLSGIGAPGSCGGAFAQDLNARWCATCPRPSHNPGAGAVMQAQMWYRDPGSTSNQTSSMSDAIEFTVGP